MFTSVFPALETSKSPRKTGAQISYYKQKGWERKAGFYGQGSRQDNDFLSHVSVASLVHTEFPSAAFEERQNEWKILRGDPKHVYMGQLKSNPLKADRLSMEVPCYPAAWSLFNALSWKRSENQVPRSYKAHNLCLAEVLNSDGCCYLCKVKWHCPEWGFLYETLKGWSPSSFRALGTLPLTGMGAALGCQCSSVSMVVWFSPLRKKHLLSVRDICSILYPHLGTGVYSCRTAPNSPGTCVWVKTVLNKLTTYNPPLYQPKIITSLMKYYPCPEQLKILASSVVEATFGPHSVPAYLQQTPYRGTKNLPFLLMTSTSYHCVSSHTSYKKISEIEFMLTKLWIKFSPSSNFPCKFSKSYAMQCLLIFLLSSRFWNALFNWGNRSHMSPAQSTFYGYGYLYVLMHLLIIFLKKFWNKTLLCN